MKCDCAGLGTTTKGAPISITNALLYRLSYRGVPARWGSNPLNM
jgi:hypothetical protein